MYSLPSTVLAEEYIDGKEYSVEGFVFQEEFYPIGITKKFIEKGPFFNEKGHIFPDTSISKEIRDVIYQELIKAHKALGLQNCFTHSEIRLNNNIPYVIELGARLGGDYIPRLVDEVLKVDTSDIAIRCATDRFAKQDRDNQKIDYSNYNGNYASIYFISCPKEMSGKKFYEIQVEETDFDIVELSSYIEKGERIYTKDNNRIGHIILKTESFEETYQLMNDMHKYINIITQD